MRERLGHAKDYAISMWKILQYKKPDDKLLLLIKKILSKTFLMLLQKLSIDIIWKGSGIKEKGVDRKSVE